MLIPLIGLFPYVFAVKKLFRSQELAADGLAVQTTGDPQTAMETLRKIANNGVNPGIHDTDVSSHPTIGARLTAIQGMA